MKIKKLLVISGIVTALTAILIYLITTALNDNEIPINGVYVFKETVRYEK